MISLLITFMLNYKEEKLFIFIIYTIKLHNKYYSLILVIQSLL